VKRLRRAFIVVWILLGLGGALGLGRGGRLVLPHLLYPHVMFNQHLRTVWVHEYAGPDGVRHPLAELVPNTSLGYARARLFINLFFAPDYRLEVCLRALHRGGGPYTFYTDEYQVDVDPRRPARTTAFRCEEDVFRKE
jgi:hypothetical protein